MSQKPSLNNILFGAGNPLLDISANVSKEFAVEKYKSEFGNAVLANEENMGVYDDLVQNYDVTYTAGGATMNVFRVFAWMTKQFRVDEPLCNFMGCISNDKFGNILEKEAENAGVKTHFQISEKNPTGSCAVLVVKEERSLIANLAAANDFTVDHLEKESVQDAMKLAKFFYISGFFLTVSPQAMIKIGEHALKENKVFMINLSAIFVVEAFIDALNSVIPYADFIIANEDEAAAIDKQMGWNVKDLEKIAEKTALLPKKNKKRNRVVVYTQRHNPIAVARVLDDGSVETFSVPVTKLDKVVDSNGAGDSFCGGFIAALVQGCDLKTCIKAGEYAAQYCLQRSGVVFDGPSQFKFE